VKGFSSAQPPRAFQRADKTVLSGAPSQQKSLLIKKSARYLL
jgi:hypothetical protein